MILVAREGRFLVRRAHHEPGRGVTRTGWAYHERAGPVLSC